MRRTRALALLVVLTVVAAFAASAYAAEPEPPGTVAVSTDIGPDSTLWVSPGRVVWNGVSGDHPILDRRVGYASSAITLGAQSTIADAGTFAYRYYHVGISSGARTLWAEPVPGTYRSVVKLTSGATTKVLTYNGVPVRLSGNRALYQGTGRHYFLYDIHTGKTTDVTEKYGTRTSSYSFTVDLFGNYLVYTTKAFTIMRKNLSDGSKPVVVAAGSNGCCNGSEVIAYGDWVAWDRYFHPGDGFEAFDSCGLRNVRTMAPATKTCVDDLTSAGVLFHSETTSHVNTWKVQPYGAIDPDITLPVPASTYALGIDGHVLAWGDTDGLHAAPMPIGTAPPVRPRSLGNPVTNKTYRIGGTTWPFRLVTTGVLTSCYIKITQRGGLIRTLPCDTDMMSVGEVLVRWNGLDNQAHQAPPGVYRWTVIAKNGANYLQRSDGVVRGTTGVVTITN